MKKGIMRSLVILTIALSFYTLPSNTALAEIEQEDSSSKTYNKLKKINQTLSSQLYEKQGYLTNDNHSNDTNTDWLPFVKNIKYLKNNQLEIYVTSNFKKLKKSHRQEILLNAQSFTLRTIDKLKDFSQKDYMDGFSSLIFCNGDYLGRSKFLSNKDFIWHE